MHYFVNYILVKNLLSVYINHTYEWFKNIIAHIRQLDKYFTKIKSRNHAAHWLLL